MLWCLLRTGANVITDRAIVAFWRVLACTPVLLGKARGPPLACVLSPEGG
jgi:hypothetical protein